MPKNAQGNAGVAAKFFFEFCFRSEGKRLLPMFLNGPGCTRGTIMAALGLDASNLRKVNFNVGVFRLFFQICSSRGCVEVSDPVKHESSKQRQRMLSNRFFDLNASRDERKTKTATQATLEKQL